MIEKIILDYLSKNLSAPVSMEVQQGQTDFVVIEKTGSSADNHIDSATIAVQSYGRTMYKAAELNEKVKAAMERLIELDSVSKCELNTDYNFTDTDKKQYRYQAVFDVVY